MPSEDRRLLPSLSAWPRKLTPFMFAGFEVTPGGMGWGQAGTGESHHPAAVYSC